MGKKWGPLYIFLVTLVTAGFFEARPRVTKMLEKVVTGYHFLVTVKSGNFLVTCLRLRSRC